MRCATAAAAAMGLTGLLAACTLTRPDYTSPAVHVGHAAFARTLEAHTQSTPVDGNRAQILQNGDEIFPAMLAAIRGAKRTITSPTSCTRTARWPRRWRRRWPSAAGPAYRSACSWTQ